jgi:hypothetical protein
MSDTPNEEEVLDLGALSDEDIATLSPAQVEAALRGELAAGEGEPANDDNTPDEQGESESAAAGEEEVTGDVEAGGAADDFQPLDPYGDMAGNTSAGQPDGVGNEEGSFEATGQSGEDDQASEAPGEAEGEADATGDTDWQAKFEAVEAQYQALMSDFKASGRTVKLESPDDARRLMQMGYDYTNKMRDMKPHLKVLKTLEHNDLLDAEKINFAIDLMKGNPEAIKKFLKDKEIDPIDLSLEDSPDYVATDHSVSDEQVALDEVLDSIRSTETFPRLAQVITKEWDKPSQEVLMGIPSLIGVINDHMQQGYYDQIVAKVDYERSLGRLRGLNDLDAYKAVGDAMQKQGVFRAPAGSGTTPPVESGQGQQDPKGSTSGSGKRARKRAASPPKGGAGAGKAQQKNYLGDFTDEEIASMG